MNFYPFPDWVRMRQLKGKVKENAREKRERKKDFMENKEKAFSIGNFSPSGRLQNTDNLETS